MPVFIDDLHEAIHNPHISPGDIHNMKQIKAERYAVSLYPPYLVIVDCDHPDWRTLSMNHDAPFVIEKILGRKEPDEIGYEYVFNEGEEERLEKKCSELNMK